LEEERRVKKRNSTEGQLNNREKGEKGLEVISACIARILMISISDWN